MSAQKERTDSEKRIAEIVYTNCPDLIGTVKGEQIITEVAALLDQALRKDLPTEVLK